MCPRLAYLDNLLSVPDSVNVTELKLFSVLRVEKLNPILLPRYRRLEHATRVDSDDGRYRMQKCDKDYDDGSVIYAAQL